ncbi:MAG TPA: hypothetical protein VNA25_13520 [Phycisphaerae bacterium]|nr:hypothetical protein [Phycisphaerae bacterium]
MAPRTVEILIQARNEARAGVDAAMADISRLNAAGRRLEAAGKAYAAPQTAQQLQASEINLAQSIAAQRTEIERRALAERMAGMEAAAAQEWQIGQQRIAADMTAYRQRTALEDRYLAATQGRLAAELSQHDAYYAALRARHAGNAQMLGLIDKTYAAERGKIIQEAEGEGTVLSAARWMRLGMRSVVYARAIAGGLDLATLAVRAFKRDWEGVDEKMRQLPFGMGLAYTAARAFRAEIDGTADAVKRLTKAWEEFQHQAAARAKYVGLVASAQDLRLSLAEERKLIGKTGVELDRERLRQEYEQRRGVIKRLKEQGAPRGQTAAAMEELHKWKADKENEILKALVASWVAKVQSDQKRTAEQQRDDDRALAESRANLIENEEAKKREFMRIRHEAEINQAISEGRNLEKIRETQANEETALRNEQTRAREEEEKKNTEAAAGSYQALVDRKAQMDAGAIEDRRQREEALIRAKYAAEMRQAKSMAEVMLLNQMRKQELAGIKDIERHVGIAPIERGFLTQAPPGFDAEREAAKRQAEIAKNTKLAAEELKKVIGEVKNLGLLITKAGGVLIANFD